ncbi:MAG: hypothetical protein J3K34DRAFT_516284 [Monoraphidium minutum]|nr:MAG: hypothetical protein J3K34DRAFT_516284 [Monoraphidium minutum]
MPTKLSNIKNWISRKAPDAAVGSAGSPAKAEQRLTAAAPRGKGAPAARAAAAKHSPLPSWGKKAQTLDVECSGCDTSALDGGSSDGGGAQEHSSSSFAPPHLLRQDSYRQQQLGAAQEMLARHMADVGSLGGSSRRSSVTGDACGGGGGEPLLSQVEALMSEHRLSLLEQQRLRAQLGAASEALAQARVQGDRLSALGQHRADELERVRGDLDSAGRTIQRLKGARTISSTRIVVPPPSLPAPAPAAAARRAEANEAAGAAAAGPGVRRGGGGGGARTAAAVAADAQAAAWDGWMEGRRGAGARRGGGSAGRAAGAGAPPKLSAESSESGLSSAAGSRPSSRAQQQQPFRVQRRPWLQGGGTGAAPPLPPPAAARTPTPTQPRAAAAAPHQGGGGFEAGGGAGARQAGAPFGSIDELCSERGSRGGGEAATAERRPEAEAAAEAGAPSDSDGSQRHRSASPLVGRRAARAADRGAFGSMIAASQPLRARAAPTEHARHAAPAPAPAPGPAAAALADALERAAAGAGAAAAPRRHHDEYGDLSSCSTSSGSEFAADLWLHEPRADARGSQEGSAACVSPPGSARAPSPLPACSPPRLPGVPEGGAPGKREPGAGTGARAPHASSSGESASAACAGRQQPESIGSEAAMRGVRAPVAASPAAGKGRAVSGATMPPRSPQHHYLQQQPQWPPHSPRPSPAAGQHLGPLAAAVAARRRTSGGGTPAAAASPRPGQHAGAARGTGGWPAAAPSAGIDAAYRSIDSAFTSGSAFTSTTAGDLSLTHPSSGGGGSRARPPNVPLLPLSALARAQAAEAEARGAALQQLVEAGRGGGCGGGGASAAAAGAPRAATPPPAPRHSQDVMPLLSQPAGQERSAGGSATRPGTAQSTVEAVPSSAGTPRQLSGRGNSFLTKRPEHLYASHSTAYAMYSPLHSGLRSVPGSARPSPAPSAAGDATPRLPTPSPGATPSPGGYGGSGAPSARGGGGSQQQQQQQWDQEEDEDEDEYEEEDEEEESYDKSEEQDAVLSEGSDQRGWRQQQQPQQHQAAPQQRRSPLPPCPHVASPAHKASEPGSPLSAARGGGSPRRDWTGGLPPAAAAAASPVKWARGAPAVGSPRTSPRPSPANRPAATPTAASPRAEKAAGAAGCAAAGGGASPSTCSAVLLGSVTAGAFGGASASPRPARLRSTPRSTPGAESGWAAAAARGGAEEDGGSGGPVWRQGLPLGAPHPLRASALEDLLGSGSRGSTFPSGAPDSGGCPGVSVSFSGMRLAARDGPAAAPGSAAGGPALSSPLGGGAAAAGGAAARSAARSSCCSSIGGGEYAAASPADHRASPRHAVPAPPVQAPLPAAAHSAARPAAAGAPVGGGAPPAARGPGPLFGRDSMRSYHNPMAADSLQDARDMARVLRGTLMRSDEALARGRDQQPRRGGGGGGFGGGCSASGGGVSGGAGGSDLGSPLSYGLSGGGASAGTPGVSPAWQGAAAASPLARGGSDAADEARLAAGVRRRRKWQVAAGGDCSPGASVFGCGSHESGSGAWRPEAAPLPDQQQPSPAAAAAGGDGPRAEPRHSPAPRSAGKGNVFQNPLFAAVALGSPSASLG